MNPTVLRAIRVVVLMCAVAMVAHGQTKTPSCPDGKVPVLGKCFDPCPDGYAHDSQGKCTLCASGYQKNPKTGACQKPAS